MRERVYVLGRKEFLFLSLIGFFGSGGFGIFF